MPLRSDMTPQQFDDGYYYASELAAFARTLGIRDAGGLRKIELEDQIRGHLRGDVSPAEQVAPAVAPRRTGRRGATRDVLRPGTEVVDYVDDAATKDLLRRCVQERRPGLAPKSGQWYWLNRWREDQLAHGVPITYDDLARHLQELMETEGRLPQIPSAQMNNFLTDLRADPVTADWSHQHAMEAWRWLKRQPGPKTYAQFRRLRPDLTAT